MAVSLGSVDSFVPPVLRFVSGGLILLTLGLFFLVINAATPGLVSWIAVNWFGIGFCIDGFLPAFWGSILVSVVSFMLSHFV